MLGICFFTLRENTPSDPYQKGEKGVVRENTPSDPYQKGEKGVGVGTPSPELAGASGSGVPTRLHHQVFHTDYKKSKFLAVSALLATTQNQSKSA